MADETKKTDAGLLAAPIMRDGKLVRAGRKAVDADEEKLAAGTVGAAPETDGEGDDAPAKGGRKAAK